MRERPRFCAALCALLLLALALPAVANGADSSVPVVPYRYSYIYDIDARLDINGGVAHCVGTLNGRYNGNTNAVTAILQARITSDSPWQYVVSWRASSIGLQEASAEGTHSLLSGYQYRVYVSGTVSAPDGTVLERSSASGPVHSY